MSEPPFDDPLDDAPDASSKEAASEEETQAANALRQALEGRPGGTHLPEAALEAAALLRFSADAGRLSQQRRATLRADLMASLAAASGRAEKQREDQPSKRWPSKGWRHWLGLGLTLAGGVTAVVVIGVIGARQLSEPAANQEAHRADERNASAPSAARAPASSSAAETTETAQTAPAEAAASAARAEPEAPARRVAERARESMPAAQVAAAPSAAGSPSKGLAARAPSGADTPGGGALESRRQLIAPTAPTAPEASHAQARDDEGDGFALGAATGRSAAASERPAAEAKKAKAELPAVPTEQVQRASDHYRTRLLADLADRRLDDAYAESDRAQSQAELERAQARLGVLASSGLGASADAERLRPDIYCRLAEIALRLGQPQTALDWARRGLALGAPASPFVARLYLLEGQAKSALGDRDGAARSYLKAIQVNEQLLDESLDGP
jgi:predicted negative regulator of RcsB-dependent stress response